MKWPKLKTPNYTLSSEESLSYKELNETEFKKEVKYDDEHLWSRYELPYEMDKQQQREYEIFCSGWLQFYDKIIKHNDPVHDHLLYFAWTKEIVKGKIPFFVNIFLNPAPIKKKKESQSKLTDASQRSAENGKGGAGDTTAGLNQQVDPPPVPPPPPPPRD